MADAFSDRLARAIDAHTRSAAADQRDQTEALLELALWEAGAAARNIPSTAEWLFREPTFSEWIDRRSRGVLRDRAIAARVLAVAADGLDPGSALAPRVTQRTRALLSHPESAVWIPAARALGRLAHRHTGARTLVFEWLSSDNRGERRRAAAALGSMPGDDWDLETWIKELFTYEGDPWVIASLGASVPTLMCERRDLWDGIAERISTALDKIARAEESALGAEVLASATEGLLVAKRRGLATRSGDRLLDKIRGVALEAETPSITTAQLWLRIVRATDFLDGLDPDPTDPDRLLDRAVSSALQAGVEKVAPRAAAIAESIGPLFDGALASLEKKASVADRARCLYSLESAARAAALELFVPLARAAGVAPSDLAPVREAMAAKVSALFHRDQPDFPLHRSALRALAYHADAADSETRGRAAAFVFATIDGTSWLRHTKKRLASRFRKPLGDLMWRILDATRAAPPALPLPDSVVYSRFAAWWAISAKSAEPLEFLGRAEAAARDDESVPKAVEAIRFLLRSATNSETESFTGAVLGTVKRLGAEDTALYASLRELGLALDRARRARALPGSAAKKEALLGLGRAAAEIAPLLNDPERALAQPEAARAADDAVEQLVVRSLQLLTGPADDEGRTVERWRLALGPALGPVVKHAVEQLIASGARSVPAPPAPDPDQERSIGGYRMLSRLGGGAQGDVWLVERATSGRRFVMKILRREPYATPDRLARMDRALAAESEVLRQIYHPNVASFVDSGVDGDRRFLVLEWLVGADLLAYARARTLTAIELRPIVEDVANGLLALQSFGLVHSDLNPQNLFLRLALPAGSGFTPDRHRDPAAAPLLGAVVIDFGIARSQVAVAEGERTVSGTPGFIAPEQTEGRVHPNTDVYGLAATIFRAITGVAFFEAADSLTSRLLLHQAQPPLTDTRNIRHWPRGAPPALLGLLEEATRLEPDKRPDIRTFARRFVELSA